DVLGASRALALEKVPQRRSALADDRITVRQQQKVEVEIEEPLVRGAEPRLVGLGAVHEPVGDEAQRSVRPPADHAVGDSQGGMAWAEEGGLVGAQRVDLVRDDAAGKLVTPLVRPDLATTLELVGALRVDPDRAAELP